MNELFVNVKVDREERPDVDAIYMDAVQAMTGRGGWPMTVFLTPDGQPFFGGTYFPQAAASCSCWRAIDDAWRNQPRRAARAGRRSSREALGRTSTLAPGRRACPAPTRLERRAAAARRSRSTAEWGGFGAAPKFPQTMSLELLLRAHCRTGAGDGAAHVVTTSLDAMASGGIYDHLGGGFARYSVDAQLAGAALREDALRPGAARPGLPPRLAGHRRGALPPGARRDDRLRAARPAPRRTAASPRPRTPTRERRRRAGSTSGRPTRSRAVLGDDAAPRRASSGTASPRPATSRAATILNRTTCAATSRARRTIEDGRASAVRRPRARGSGPGSTTRCSPSGTR